MSERIIFGFQPSKLRDLHFDVLIALTARSHDAWVMALPAFPGAVV